MRKYEFILAEKTYGIIIKNYLCSYSDLGEMFKSICATRILGKQTDYRTQFPRYIDPETGVQYSSSTANEKAPHICEALSMVISRGIEPAVSNIVTRI